MYLAFRNQGQGPITHGLKSIDRFYDTILPCPTLVLSGKNEPEILCIPYRCRLKCTDRASVVCYIPYTYGYFFTDP